MCNNQINYLFNKITLTLSNTSGICLVLVRPLVDFLELFVVIIFSRSTT